jgi:APA family basic amino acid/polyamine antiporter
MVWWCGGSRAASARNHELLKEWFTAVKRTPQILKRMAFRRRTLEEELREALLRGSMRKAFGGFDLLMLGLGITVASGYAQLTGYAAQEFAGPAVILSYMFSGMAALLAACCFAELSQEFPVAGGAFSFVMATFGELAAFIALGGLLLEYVVGMAAVARGFSRQLARLCNQDPLTFVINIGGDYSSHFLDIMAAAIVLLMSVLLSLGVRESAWFISGVTVFKLLLLVVIAIVGYVQGTWDNAEPFIDPNFGADGIFLGAAVLYFTYVGFDAISNAAEETRDVRHMPWAIVGTPLVAMIFYILLSTALAMATTPNPKAALPWNPALGPDDPGQGFPFGPYAGVSFPNLDTCNGPGNTFTIAFVHLQGLKYMQYIIAVATLMGIVTALTVGLFSASRIVMSAARDWWVIPSV